MDTLFRREGRVAGVNRDGAMVPKDDSNRDWREFLKWNAQQPTPLDLSDVPYTPPVPTRDDQLDQLSLGNRLTAAHNEMWWARSQVPPVAPPAWAVNLVQQAHVKIAAL